VGGLAEVGIVHGDDEIALLHSPIGSHSPLGRNALGVHSGPFTAGCILDILRGDGKAQGPPRLVSERENSPSERAATKEEGKAS
jgi:hypothetical protein